MRTQAILLLSLVLLTLSSFGITHTVTITNGNNVWAPSAGSFAAAAVAAEGKGDTIIFDYQSLGPNITINLEASFINYATFGGLVVDGLRGLPAGSQLPKIRSLGSPGEWAGIVYIGRPNTTLIGLDMGMTDGNSIMVKAINCVIDSCYFYGNKAHGVKIEVGGDNCLIKNSVFGLNQNGLESGNDWNGIFTLNGNNLTVTGSTIVHNGKAANGTPERISGIRVEGSINANISNCFIGTDKNGANRGNGYDGITIYENSHNATITGNVICFNGFINYANQHGEGIAVRNSNNAKIQSNFIGVLSDKSTPGGNNGKGISIEGSTNCLIGGATVNLGNVIAATASALEGTGILLIDRNGTASTGNEIYNNLIGDVLSTNPVLGNKGAGISIEGNSDNNIVGALGQGNIFVGNNTGITVDGSTAEKNTLRYNSFSCNTNRGILLSNAGNDDYGFSAGTKIVTTNDNEIRPNMISGTAPANALVDIYVRSASCAVACDNDAAQGITFVTTVTANTSGNWEYDYSSTPTVTKANAIVVATEPNGAGNSNTSEFSICKPVCNAPSNVSISANDASLCAGETAMLTANANGIVSGASYSYKWYTGSNIYQGTLIAYSVNSNTLAVTTAGTYFVLIADISDTTTCRDSSAGMPITVTPLPSINVVPTSNSICTGQTTTIDAGATGATPGEVITWSTGESINPITVSTGGTYTVTITNAENCVSSGSATITENPNPNPALVDQSFCQGDNVTFDAGAGTGYSYLWTPGGEISQTITVSTSGTYGVTVTANGCTGTSSANASQSPDPKPVVTITGTDTICLPKGESADLVAMVTAGTTGTYVWSKGSSSDSLINIADTGLVSLKFTDAYNCEGTADFTIYNYCIPPISNVPNVFIPGGTDNPTWTPIGTITPSDILESHFEVYNRWGRKMFETTDFPVWDGTFKGNAASSGVYFWIWNYTDVTQTSYNLNGFVHLIRK